MKHRIISAALAFVFLVSMTFPTMAAETKKTYDERVQELQEKYGVTYSYAKYAAPKNQEQKEWSLDCLEQALKIIGTSSMSKISGYYIKANGKFSVQVGDNSGEYGLAGGYFTNGVVTFTPPSIGSKDKYTTKEMETSKRVSDIIHELGHAYDVGVLQSGGGAALAAINGSYNVKLDHDKFYRQYCHHYANQSQYEDFAVTFAWMLTSNKPITDQYINYSTKDPLYKKCEAIYEMMLRDFGAKSAATKRAAAFLSKELPKE